MAESKTKELEFLDLASVDVDDLSAQKLNSYRLYSAGALQEVLDNVNDILIDCQHKGWSGTLESITETYIELGGKPSLENGLRAPAVALEFVPKKGKAFTINVKLDGAIFQKVSAIYIGTIEGLNRLIPQEKAASKK